MLSFLKSKPKLKELIPQGYIDIHSHVLFGIDDGAKVPMDSQFLMESMINMGFGKCITTPHTIHSVWDNTSEGIQQRCEEVWEILPECSKKLALKSASEYMMDHNFITLLKDQPLLTLKDNYILVEMSYINPPIQLFDIIFEIKLAGYQPVLAHPERYLFYHNDFSKYEKLKKSGCLFQMNLLSATGYYSEGVAKVSDQLLKKGLYDFAGSDIHHEKHVKAFDNQLKIKETEGLKEVMNNNRLFL